MLRFALLSVAVFSIVAPNTIAIAESVTVEATKDNWHSESLTLEPNKSYVIVPDPNSRWTNGGGTEKDFHGDGDFKGSETPDSEFPGDLRHGQLIGLISHHTDDPARNAKEYISFPPGTDYAYVRIGPRGGKLYFMMADVKAGYGDNGGVCSVRVEKDDGTAYPYRPHLPATVRRGFAKWVIAANGELKCEIDFTVGSGIGSKHYWSALVVEYSDGSFEHRTAHVTKGRPATGTRRGEETDRSIQALDSNKTGQIRRAYVLLEQESSSPDTIRKAKDHLLDILDDADRDYERLKQNELIRDAIILITSG